MGESGSGSVIGWHVEARSFDGRALECNGMLLDGEWKRIEFRSEPGGVPGGPSFRQPWLALTGRYSYESAQALRWWWVAEANARTFGRWGCVETRLVRAQIDYSYEVIDNPSPDDFLVSGETTRFVDSAKVEDSK